MKKVVVEKPGGYSQLTIQEGETPQPGRGEILVGCKACGVNFADCCVRMGVYASAKEFVGWPITPGFEVAGEVIEVGEDVSCFKKGDRVIALTRFGGYTTHLVVHETQAFSLPENLSYEEGASFPVIFLTASYAVHELAHPRPGNLVLIHSAAGGVGSALVQLCCLQGCRVIGVVGAEHKIDVVKELGAEGVINKSSQKLWEEAENYAPKGYDVIFDANGPETLKQSYHHLSQGGKVVVYGFHTLLSKGRGTLNWLNVIWGYLKMPRFNPLKMTTDNHSVLAFNLSYMFDQSDLLQEGMSRTFSLLDEGKLRVPKIETFPLGEVAEAHRALESGKTVGKLVLVP